MAVDDDHSSTHDGPTGIPGTDELMSAWPPFVALGFVVAEIGIVLNLIPLSVGGILLFGGSVAGILQDASITRRPWHSMAIVGIIFAILGGALMWTQLQTLTVAHVVAVASSNPIAIRGEAVLVAGVLLIVGAVAGTIVEPLRNTS